MRTDIGMMAGGVVNSTLACYHKKVNIVYTAYQNRHMTVMLLFSAALTPLYIYGVRRKLPSALPVAIAITNIACLYMVNIVSSIRMEEMFQILVHPPQNKSSFFQAIVQSIALSCRLTAFIFTISILFIAGLFAVLAQNRNLALPVCLCAGAMIRALRIDYDLIQVRQILLQELNECK